MAAIVIVIIVCGSALGIVGIETSFTNSRMGGAPTTTVTATVTTTLISTSTMTINSTNTTLFSPQVAVTAVSLLSSDFLSSNTGVTFACGSAARSFLILSNTGTAGTSVTLVTITWAGQSNRFMLAAGSCTIGASGSSTATQNLLFAESKLLTTATAGGKFVGSVNLANGDVLLFTGNFDGPQGSAQVSVTATGLLAATFTAGTPVAATCGAAANSYITLTNVGTASGLPTLVTITAGGATNSFAVTSSTACNVGAVGAASNTANILFGGAGANRLSVAAGAGNAYTGTVTMSNGAVLLFTGTFQ